MKVNESNHQARPVYCVFNLIERDELRLLDRFVSRTDVRKRMKREESALGSVGDEDGDLLLDDKGRDDGVGVQTNEQNE